MTTVGLQTLATAMPALYTRRTEFRLRRAIEEALRG